MVTLHYFPGDWKWLGQPGERVGKMGNHGKGEGGRGGEMGYHIGRQMANEKDSGKEKCNGSGGTRTTSGIGLHAWK